MFCEFPRSSRRLLAEQSSLPSEERFICGCRVDKLSDKDADLHCTIACTTMLILRMATSRPFGNSSES
eukprot:704915-Pleurochrysis_carterae.AAC.2